MRLPLLAGALLATVVAGDAQVSQLNYHNDLGSTGRNLAETQLNPASVNPATFGKIFAAAVDGQIYAQPLFVPGVAIGGVSRSAVYVATEHDSVYAIDAGSGAVLWTVSALGPGEIPMPSDDTGTADLLPEIGITSTPVISAAADGTGARYLYAVAKSRRTISGLNHYYLRLHAFDIATGAAKPGSPALIAETVNNGDGSYAYLSGPAVAGTGDGAVNGVVTMNAQRTHQRCSLGIVNGRIYFGSASHGTNGPYHGWVLGYDPATLARTAVWCTTPNGGLGGVWMGGNLITADAAGALYLATGNGAFGLYNAGREPVPADFDANGFPLNRNFGDSVLKLVPDSSTAANPNPNGWGLALVDYFCPVNERDLDTGDLDLGSGGVLLLPDSAGSAAHPTLLAAGGKEGRIYLIDRANMGKFRGGVTAGAFNASGDAAVQVTPPDTVHGILSTPAFFNGQLYYAGGYSDRGKTFRIANGAIDLPAVAQTPDSYGYLGSTPTVSANGANNGVVWCLDRGSNQLRAYAADNFANELYTSGEAPDTRDRLGTAVKFGVPTVVNGSVYAGTSEGAGPSALVCYGLFAAPDNPPAQPSNLYAQTISGGEIDLFWTDNATNESGSEVYVSTDPNAFSPTPYATLGVDRTACAVMGLSLNTAYYFRVRAINSVGSSAYSNAAGTTSGQAAPVEFSKGFASAAGLLAANGFAGSPVAGAVLRLIDGKGNEARSVWSQTAQSVAQFTTEFVFQFTAPDADGFTFCLQQAGLNAVGPSGGGLGYGGIAPSAAVKFDIYPGVSTTGLYLNGADPNDGTAATAASSGAIPVGGMDFHLGHPIRVILTYDGAARILRESLTDLTTRAVFSQAYAVDLSAFLNAGATAFVGFTGSTGGLTATADILSWSFSSTLAATPAAPTALTAAAASGTQIDLSWADNAGDETGFRIERKTGAGGAYAVVGSVGANSTGYHDANLLTNTLYFYRVAATHSSLLSAYSNEASLVTPVPPATPSGPQVTFLAASRVDFTWVDNASNETGYRILRQANDNGFQTIATLAPGTTAYSDAGLSPETTYDYHIQAFNAAGNVDFAGLSIRTPSAVSIAAADATAQLGTADTGAFVIRRTSALGTALTVNYTISGPAADGTRYTLAPAPGGATAGSVTIAANASLATVTLTPAASGPVQGAQTVTLTLANGAGYTPSGAVSASVSLLDDPVGVWKIQVFGGVAAAQSAPAADAADADGDGLSNLLEYALGADPARPSPAALPRTALETVDGGRYLTLTYVRPRPAPLGITYAPESALDLGAWSPAAIVGGYPVDNGNGTETCKARAAVPAGGAVSRAFLRLRVTRN